MKKSILKEKLKEILRPLVLQEITMDAAKASKVNPEPVELVKKLEKCIESVDSDAKVIFNQENGKIKIVDSDAGKKFTIEVTRNGDLFNVVAMLDGSERLSLTATKFENIEKLIKETLKGRKEGSSYTEKAYKKSAIPEKEEKKVEEKSEKDADQSKEADGKKLKKQIDHKPVDVKDRDIEEVVKGTAGMKDSTKFEKQVDIKSKDKVKLKSDKKNNSEEKLTQKMDGTSKMKALKEEIKKSIREMLKETASKKIKESFSQRQEPNINDTFVNSLKPLESKGFKIEYGYAEYYDGSMTIQVRKDKQKNKIAVEQFFDNERINDERAKTLYFSDINSAIKSALELKNSPFAGFGENKNIKESSWRIDDPTKEEMVKFLKARYAGLGYEQDSAEVAIYWFATHYYNGQASNLYSVLSSSPYKPSRLSRGIETEDDDFAKMMYEDLEEKYGNPSSGNSTDGGVDTKKEINEANNQKYIELTDEQVDKLKLVFPTFDEYEIEYNGDGEITNDSFDHAFGTQKEFGFEVHNINVKIQDKWYPIIKDDIETVNPIIELTEKQLRKIDDTLENETKNKPMRRFNSRINEDSRGNEMDKIMQRGRDITKEMKEYAKSKGHI
jgi:hypothetical protein